MTLGAILGHALCTGMAVIGGKVALLAAFRPCAHADACRAVQWLSAQLSEKVIHTGGGLLFLAFAAYNCILGPR